MAQAMTLPIVAGLSILGTAFGVHLGRSAVAEINPAYFSEPETRFHADLVPYRAPDWAQVQVTEYQDAALAQGLGTGCVGCREYPEEYFPAHDSAVDGYEDGGAASIQYAATETYQGEPEAADPDPEWEQVVRYASYPVSAEEQAPLAETPDEEAYSGTD
jgi:hypothetical protein